MEYKVNTPKLEYKMNETKLQDLMFQSGFIGSDGNTVFGTCHQTAIKNLVNLVMEDMHKQVISSIIITDVLMEENKKIPTSEDYIIAINKDFGFVDA